MNVEKTKAFYEKINHDDLCSCAYCQNYIKEIRSSYPTLAEYLERLGVDIEKPFQTMPLEPDKTGYIEYLGSQYIVCGKRDAFEKTTINDVNVDIALSHPPTGLEEEHFVIEIYPIRLKWVI